jgi:hypothetical protein
MVSAEIESVSCARFRRNFEISRAFSAIAVMGRSEAKREEGANLMATRIAESQSIDGKPWLGQNRVLLGYTNVYVLHPPRR